MSRSTLPTHEHARAILVVDSTRRVTYLDVARGPEESIEDYGERLKQAAINQLRRMNS